MVIMVNQGVIEIRLTSPSDSARYHTKYQHEKRARRAA